MLFTNDFVTTSIATDHVSFSPRPDRWKIRSLMLTAIPLAGLMVTFSLSMLFVGRDLLSFSSNQIRTPAFLTLVFGGQEPCIWCASEVTSGARVPAAGCSWLPLRTLPLSGFLRSRDLDRAAPG